MLEKLGPNSVFIGSTFSVPNVLVGRAVVEKLKQLPFVLYSKVITADR